jgi:kynurenine 3-monooxygenase
VSGAGRVSILGAGPTGTLLSLLLQRRGLQVTLYEARADPRGHSGESGRSINLALADRGIHALKLAGVYDTIAQHLVPMRGRMVHPKDGAESLHLYGQRPSEVIYSVSRHRLNQALLEIAVGRHGVEVHFEHRLEDADFASGIATVRDLRRDRLLHLAMEPMLAADGAGSGMRQRMQAAGLIDVDEAALAHGYKELSIPAAADGTHRLARDALHIWPRGNFMLIALPNTDGSFTATLFLANHGEVSFAALNTPVQIRQFLSAQFPDVYPLMPECVAEFGTHPTGFLGTVYADRWSVRGMAALIGDSAHAIVPFHGQGMNCCFEDCVEFAACVGRNADWAAVFAEFFDRRKPNTDAIAAMALENYLEMRERVADPGFRLQQTLALELERRHPQRFIPRYSMVMFHHEIPYRVAQSRGLIQSRLLAALTDSAAGLDGVDYARADREISQDLPPIAPGVDAG